MKLRFLAILLLGLLFFCNGQQVRVGLEYTIPANTDTLSGFVGWKICYAPLQDSTTFFTDGQQFDPQFFVKDQLAPVGVEVVDTLLVITQNSSFGQIAVFPFNMDQIVGTGKASNVFTIPKFPAPVQAGKPHVIPLGKVFK